MTSELATHFHITSELTHTFVRFGVLAGLITSLVFCVLAAKAYLNNGYARADAQVNLEQRKAKVLQTRRNKIFK